MTTENKLPTAEGSPERLVRRRVYFTMILHPLNGWIRVGKAYAKREVAKSWLSFARSAWHKWPGKVSSCLLVTIDGEPDAATVKRLDAFNMDPIETPNSKINEPSSHNK